MLTGGGSEPIGGSWTGQTAIRKGVASESTNLLDTVSKLRAENDSLRQQVERLQDMLRTSGSSGGRLVPGAPLYTLPENRGRMDVV